MYQIDIAPDFMGVFQLSSVKDCPEYVEWLEHGLWIIEIWAQISALLSASCVSPSKLLFLAWVYKNNSHYSQSICVLIIVLFILSILLVECLILSLYSISNIEEPHLSVIAKSHHKHLGSVPLSHLKYWLITSSGPSNLVFF